MRGKEPFACWRKWPVEFALNPVGISENQVGAPFGPVSGDIQKGQAGGKGEVNIVALRSIHFKTQLKDRRGVKLFVHGDQQAHLPVPFGNLVSGSIVAADSGQPGKQTLQLFFVDGFADLRLQEPFQIYLRFRIRSFNLHELRYRDIISEMRFAPIQVRCPVGIIQGVLLQESAIFGWRLRSLSG